MEEKSFRDKVSTISEDGKRVWVFPKIPKGIYYNRRKIVSYFCLILLFAGPHIRIGGEPLLLLNILERKFVLLGMVFWPQDFYLFAFAIYNRDGFRCPIYCSFWKVILWLDLSANDFHGNALSKNRILD